MPIPEFDAEGNLPPGIHDASWPEVRARFGVNARRLWLLDGLERAMASLARAGCPDLYLDGSFVTAKPHPKDFDGCWDHRGVDPTLLDPVLLNFDNLRAAQQAKYGGELFLAMSKADPNGTTFLDFFQRTRSDTRKGIVRIRLAGWKP